MTTMHLWYIAILATCAMTVMTTSPIQTPLGAEEMQTIAAPAGEEEKKDEKRSVQDCYVNGHYYRHNQEFSLPGYSHCIKYRCHNGGWSVVQPACEIKSQCIRVGSVFRENCRSLRCVKEDRGNMQYYYMTPTAQDLCDAEGQCVPKNRDFVHKNCQTYRCVETSNGGYYFQISGSQRCRDDFGNCIRVGDNFSKVVNGRHYNNCLCLNGGGYTCRG